MSRAVLSIGSNLGDRLSTLRGAAGAFGEWLVAVSPVYETPPWGPVAQEPFLNAVLIADDASAAPGDWLARAHAAEQAAGRTREVRWGPRTLDVDVIAVRPAGVRDGAAVSDVTTDDPALTLPHPRAAERAFVLVPWLATDPAATLLDRPVQQWLDALEPADVAAVRLVPGASLR